MPGNIDMETQMARHIASNRSDSSERFIVLCMLACAAGTLILYLFAPLSILGAALGAFILVVLAALPLHFQRVRIRNAEIAKLKEMQMEQLSKHRAEQENEV